MKTQKISFHKKLKNIQELLDYKRNYNTKSDESGNAVITINLANDCELYHVLSPVEDRELNSEIYEYIESKAYEIPLTRNITINFVGRKIDKKDQEWIKKIIKNHYYFKIIDKNDDLKTNLIKSIALGILGASVIALYLFLSLFDRNALFLEIISVVGSFAVWEAVDYYLIERNSIKKDILDILQLSEAEVAFIE